MSQMVIIAVGQMNLAIGEIGGLSAICFAGLMQVWGFPRFSPRWRVSRSASPRVSSTAILSRAPAFRRSSSRSPSLSVFKGADLGITRAQPFYGIPASVKAFGNTTISAPFPGSPSPPRSSSRAYGICSIASGSAYTSSPSAAMRTQRSFPDFDYADGHFSACDFRPSRRARRDHAGRAPATRPALDRRRLVDPFVRRSRVGGAALSGGHVSVFGTLYGVVIVAIITQALVIFHIDPYFVEVVLGLLILWAVGVNRLREVRFQNAARPA